LGALARDELEVTADYDMCVTTSTNHALSD
jgi:hypothetical protein